MNPNVPRRLITLLAAAHVMVASATWLPSAAAAQEAGRQPAAAARVAGRQRIGMDRMFTNDALGDGQDRWRTGSYRVSVVTATDPKGVPGDAPGDVVETRLRSEIIAPANLTSPVLGGDRQYVGIFSVGRHWHWQRGGAELSAGMDMVFSGPMTGLGGFQTWVHNAIGAPVPAVLGTQIGNALRPTLLVEVARPARIPGNRAELRPFAEIRAGAETYLRLGADLTIGGLAGGGLRLRDPVSGQRGLPLGAARGTGASLVLGGDVAWVAGSAWLPPQNGYVLTPLRTRLRAGLALHGDDRSVFYGLTWLGREFRAQGSGQVVGSLSVRWRF